MPSPAPLPPAHAPTARAAHPGASRLGPALTPVDSAAFLSQCLACVVEGRPLPEAVRPVTRPLAAPASVAEGIARIVGR